MFSLFKSRKNRNKALQIGFVGFLILIVIAFILTARSNLESQGLTSGFDFLDRATGIGLNFSLIPYESSDTYSRALLIGILNSIFVGAISLTFATFIGIVVGVMRTSRNTMAKLIGTTYVEVFRNIPLLLQLFFWYAILISLPRPTKTTGIFDMFFLTGRGIFTPGLNISGNFVFFAIMVMIATSGFVLWFNYSRRFLKFDEIKKFKIKRIVWIVGLIISIVLLTIGRIPGTELINIPYLKGLNYRGGICITPELMACIVAISIYGGAYIGEIIRAGINSVSFIQSEAAHALGLSNWHKFSRIILPLAIRAVMPTMINQYIWLFKATTIGIAIGFVDFFMVVSTSINGSGQTLELIGILMGGFLMINYLIAWTLNRVNNLIKLKGIQVN